MWRRRVHRHASAPAKPFSCPSNAAAYAHSCALTFSKSDAYADSANMVAANKFFTCASGAGATASTVFCFSAHHFQSG
jgi:hypothetical protein